MNHEMCNIPLSNSVLWNIPGINYFMSIRESQQERVYRSQTFSGCKIAMQATCKTVAYTIRLSCYLIGSSHGMEWIAHMYM